MRSWEMKVAHYRLPMPWAFGLCPFLDPGSKMCFTRNTPNLWLYIKFCLAILATRFTAFTPKIHVSTKLPWKMPKMPLAFCSEIYKNVKNQLVGLGVTH